MDPTDTQDVNERIAEQVRKARRLARWLKVCEIVYVVLWAAGLVALIPSFFPTLRLSFERGGVNALFFQLSSTLQNFVYLVFLLVLAEIARRIVLVLARLAEEVKGTV